MALFAEISSNAKMRLSGHASYAGDVTPQEAWNLLTRYSESQLIDVRTDMEWTSVGVPDVSSLGKRTHTISLMTYPGMRENPLFIKTINDIFKDKNAPLLFLCKTGGRSAMAAEYAASLGYTAAFNIAQGFEGAANEAGLRNHINGWRAEGLPWRSV